MPATECQLIPLDEMAPGSVGAIRNSVIDSVVKLASSELKMTPEQLIVRDVNPVRDLIMYSTGTTTATTEDWVYTMAATAGYISVTGTQNMADNRYVALYGLRNLRAGQGTHATSTVAFAPVVIAPSISLVRITVGGADKVIWSLDSTIPYRMHEVGFSPTAVIIPQNASFNIAFYHKVAQAQIMQIQLVGIVVEPRGKVISP